MLFIGLGLSIIPSLEIFRSLDVLVKR